jgi:hypothetical protein
MKPFMMLAIAQHAYDNGPAWPMWQSSKRNSSSSNGSSSSSSSWQ